jgi:hypothetical protein
MQGVVDGEVKGEGGTLAWLQRVFLENNVRGGYDFWVVSVKVPEKSGTSWKHLQMTEVTRKE